MANPACRLVLAAVRGASAHAALLVHRVGTAVRILAVVAGVPDGERIPARHRVADTILVAEHGGGEHLRVSGLQNGHVQVSHPMSSHEHEGNHKCLSNIQASAEKEAQSLDQVRVVHHMPAVGPDRLVSQTGFLLWGPNRIIAPGTSS
jgi:hypothetical protein